MALVYHNANQILTPNRVCLQGPVNYSVVGTPVIVDDVVTGLSNKTNYLTLPQPPSVINSFEMVIRCNCGSNGLGLFMYAYPSGYYQYGGFNARTVITSSSYNPKWRYKSMQTSSSEDKSLLCPVGSGLTNATDALVFTKLTMETVTEGDYLYSYYQSLDGVAWTLLGSQHDTYRMSGADIGPITMCNNPNDGTGNTQYYARSIDLNNTYIKVNGTPWFRGTAAMTKTISVVGCTGTADLTTADKAIAEDKGWAITLS